MRFLFSILSFFAIIATAAAQNISISGYAPAYVGKTIEVYRILDYFSNMEGIIATTTVQPDSTFTFNFESSITQKVIVKSQNNKGFLFIQPGGKYEILFPEKDKYDPYKPTGNNVEVAFFNLDSTDINYKILGFQRWVDDFAGHNFYLKSRNSTDFGESLDRFKTNVEKAYKNDTSMYFKTHVRFTIAGLDNIQHAAERNRYEKHDFYIKQTPVQYENEAYMRYISNFYQKLMPRLSAEANEAVYEGVLKSSPTLIMKALGSEYTLINLRIREMVMIQSLSEMYNSIDFPQTNIITILDSLSNKCLFQANAEIARNLKHRITALNPGGKAPEFVLFQEGKETKTLSSYIEKHVYLHFFDPESAQNAKELPLLVELHKMYGAHVQFISIYKKNEVLSETALNSLKKMPWEVYGISASNSIWKQYGIESYPQYTLIDAAGYIVASPALGPIPNGEYETIDKTFFYIKQTREKE